MKSRKNTGDSVFKCFLCNDYGNLSLCVNELSILIVSEVKAKPMINDHKVKSIEKILTKFKKAGIFSVRRASYFLASGIIDRREFEVQHSDIIELLDSWGYRL